MFSRIFPQQIDNTYRGYKLAIWLLVLNVLLKLVMSFGMLVNTREVIQTGDSIPLDTFGAAAAKVVVLVFMIVGLEFLLVHLLTVVVLIRYRALIPLMYLMLTIEQVTRKAMIMANPIARTGESVLPFDVNLALSVLLVIGLALSLATPRKKQPAGAT
jgi:hypothetical protein